MQFKAVLLLAALIAGAVAAPVPAEILCKRYVPEHHTERA